MLGVSFCKTKVVNIQKISTELKIILTIEFFMTIIFVITYFLLEFVFAIFWWLPRWNYVIFDDVSSTRLKTILRFGNYNLIVWTKRNQKLKMTCCLPGNQTHFAHIMMSRLILVTKTIFWSNCFFNVSRQ